MHPIRFFRCLNIDEGIDGGVDGGDDGGDGGHNDNGVGDTTKIFHKVRPVSLKENAYKVVTS